MDWQSLISSLGFPIVACIAMGWYVKYITDKNNQQMEELNKNHKEEMVAYKDELREIINNNTLVMNHLCDLITNKGGDINEIK